MPQHVLSDTVIPECGVFPLKHPYAHNCLYSLYNFKFFKEESLSDIAQGRVKCCLEDCVQRVKAGPIEVFGSKVWEKARFLEIFNEIFQFSSSLLT